jgi:hypothetical protein
MTGDAARDTAPMRSVLHSAMRIGCRLRGITRYGANGVRFL